MCVCVCVCGGGGGGGQQEVCVWAISLSFGIEVAMKTTLLYNFECNYSKGHIKMHRNMK